MSSIFSILITARSSVFLVANLLSPPALASSHDLSGLQLFESALTFHFYISGFAHDFTFFFFSLAFLVIAFLLLPGLGFVSHIITCRGSGFRYRSWSWQLCTVHEMLSFPIPPLQDEVPHLKATVARQGDH